jgi:hypothetical protein
MVDLALMKVHGRWSTSELELKLYSKLAVGLRNYPPTDFETVVRMIRNCSTQDSKL